MEATYIYISRWLVVVTLFSVSYELRPEHVLYIIFKYTSMKSELMKFDSSPGGPEIWK
jgi:hypothetical protein